MDLSVLTELITEMIEEACYTTNPLTPFGDMTRIVRGGLVKFMKPGAAGRCKGRLKVWVSEVVGEWGKLVEGRIWEEWKDDEGKIGRGAKD